MTITDINLETRALVDADTTSYPAATLLRRVNSAYEETVGDLIVIDTKWKFDDSNYTDLPLGTSDLVEGQQDYSFDVALLAIERIEVKDVDGSWTKLKSIDDIEITEALDEYKSTNGLPVEYSIRGNSFFLYPTPTATKVTLTAGIKVYFRRTADVFTEDSSPGTPDDISKVPGFASPYHILLSYKAALPYAMSYKKDRVPLILNEINRLHIGLIAHYSNQDKDKLSKITPFIQDNR